MATRVAPDTRRRLPLLLGIGAAHAALLSFIGPLSPHSGAAAQSTPLEVTLTEELPPPPELPQIAPQWVTFDPTPLIEPPIVELPEELPRSNAITVMPTDNAPVAVTAGRTVTIDEVGYVRPPKPRYPAESRRLAEQGLVLLLVTIDESGRASRVEIQRSSGHPRLDAAAREAVEHALFRPYLENGIARTVLASIPVEFNWKGRGRDGGRDRS